MSLEFIGDRWHCDGLGIHAGDRMEMRFTENEWLPLLIEKGDHGRELFGRFNIRGAAFRRRIDPKRHALRWPTSSALADEVAMQDPQQELLALARLVDEMRHIQRNHSQTRSAGNLERSKSFEKLVDAEVERILDTQKMFEALSAV
jgi:hypothetical protein